MQQYKMEASGRFHRVFSGGVLLATGLLILLFSWDYPLGTLVQMGPGYVPRFMGLVISLLGAATLYADRKGVEGTETSLLHWRGLIFVGASIAAFAGSIEYLGLVPAMFITVFLAMLADPEARPAGILVYSLIVTLAGWLLFLVILELPIPAFWRVS